MESENRISSLNLTFQPKAPGRGPGCLFGLSDHKNTKIMESTKTSKNRGGRREGAGRKAAGETARNETVSLRLSPELKARLFQVASERGISASELMTRLIETL